MSTPVVSCPARRRWHAAPSIQSCREPLFAPAARRAAIELDRVRSVRDVDEAVLTWVRRQDGLRLHGVLTLATAQEIVMTRVLVPGTRRTGSTVELPFPAGQEAVRVEQESRR